MACRVGWVPYGDDEDLLPDPCVLGGEDDGAAAREGELEGVAPDLSQSGGRVRIDGGRQRLSTASTKLEIIEIAKPSGKLEAKSTMYPNWVTISR